MQLPLDYAVCCIRFLTNKLGYRSIIGYFWWFMDENNKNKINNNIKNLLKGIAVGFIIIALFFAGYFTHYFSLSKELRSIEYIIDIYKNHYYKDDASIPHEFASSIMDIYSGYYTKEEYQKYLKEGQGSKSGYGFAITSELQITRIAGNSPAEKAGVKVGDTIVGYKNPNDADFVPAVAGEFQNFISQNSDYITLQLRSNGSLREIDIKKGEYTENYVFYTDKSGSYRFMGEGDELNFTPYEGEGITLNSGWAYLKFTSFNGLKNGTAGGAGQFKVALDKFKENNCENLIIDLRNNGGGYLSILAQIASYLCDSDEDGRFLVQKAIYKGGREEVFYSPKSTYDNYNFKKIVFLANSGSASASEALMGAVLDYDAKSGNNIVKVVLEANSSGAYKSYGKGIMQSMFNNTLTGEAVKLTTAEIVWPLTQISIHGVGLTPELDERIVATLGDPIDYAQTL